ncbi:MAG: hypothetical protein K0S32_322 [Bacteroidetes bacterium]|nr:hypothetical protein [Bacteroidota bacterium]
MKKEAAGRNTSRFCFTDYLCFSQSHQSKMGNVLLRLLRIFCVHLRETLSIQNELIKIRLLCRITDFKIKSFGKILYDMKS